MKRLIQIIRDLFRKPPPPPAVQVTADVTAALPTPAPEPITLDAYLTSSGKYVNRLVSPELTDQVVANAMLLLERVNALLIHLRMPKVRVSSGFRTREANMAAGGAPASNHLVGMAVDIEDVGDKLDNTLRLDTHLLEQFDLYLEHPDSTIGWTHLDIKPRARRIFKP